MKGVRHCYEIATTGVDEALAGLSSSPLSGAQSMAVGLRVPSLIPAATPGVLGRYLFCLATRTVSAKTRLRGVRQLLTIGADLGSTVGEGKPPTRPVELEVTSNFHFPDGNVSWHIVQEPNITVAPRRPLTDAANFLASAPGAGPALLYQPGTCTWTAGNFNPVTGAPLYYNVGLATYQPPPVWIAWHDLGGLGNFNDIRFPWRGDHAWDTVDIPIDCTGGDQRVSFYASVLQTTGGNPATYPQNTAASPNTAVNTYDALEEGFVQTLLINGFTPIYWRVAGALIFEDEV